MKNAFLIHGAGGKPEENWLPWLKEQLEERGYEVVVPAFPTPDGQNYDNWMQVINEHLSDCHGATILVGHSIGVAFLLGVLEKLHRPVAQSIFVSGFVGLLTIEEFDSLNHTISDRVFDWDTITQNAGKVSVLHGENDPYVPLHKAEFLSTQLGVDPIIIPNGGHLNESAGFTEFPSLIKLIED